MSENSLIALILVLCFFSCNGCPGNTLVNHYIETHPCKCQ